VRGWYFSEWGRGFPNIIVYPIDNKDLKFEVRKFTDGGKWMNGDICSENYLDVFWKRQLSEKVESIFKSRTVLIGILAPYNEIKIDLNGRTIGFEEAISIYKNKIYTSISCGLFIDSNTQDIISLTKDIYPKVQKLKYPALKENKIEIIWFNESYKRQIENNPGKYLNAQGSYFNELKQNNIVKYKVSINDIKKINSVEDIINLIEK
jgi:hypothetical protein